MPVDGLDGPCGACERPAGDHTLREWAACLGTITLDLPFTEVPSDAAQLAADAVRTQFGLDDDLIIADHVVMKAAWLNGMSGHVKVKVPLLLHEFQIGVPGHPPENVARVAFIGDVKSMRAYGRLARDSANGAANAAERGR